MDWAARRRFLILVIIGAVLAAFFTVIGTSVFYKTPSCSDGLQNQGEAGIDCGSPCPYLCVDQTRAPTVLFTKAISNGVGRTDVIASVENINAAAAKNVPYTITLYGAKNVFVQEVKGTVDLPPASKTPIFFPNISSGNQKVVTAFLVIAPSAPKWYVVTGPQGTVPVVTNSVLGGSTGTPRIDATLSNAGIAPLSGVRVVVLVHDDAGEVVAASETVIPTILAQGKATATFTWNTPFLRAPASIEVVPSTSLP